MKFCEAMDALKAGHKVSRAPWGNDVYFMMDGEDVKSYKPVLRHYTYSEDIMVSDGWLVDDDVKAYKFCDIVPKLINGSRAKLAEWSGAFIYLDPSERVLVISAMDVFPFMPQFGDFVAEDWVQIQ